MSYTILVTAPSLSLAGLSLLKQRQCRVLMLKDFSDTEGLRHCLVNENVDAVISRTMTLDRKLIAASTSLKVISKHGVGVSNIDIEAAKSQGIAVYSTPGANTQSVVELTIALMLSASRHMLRFDHSVRLGEWVRSSDGVQLAGKTLGIIGFGQIGRGVAKVAQVLQMKVHVVDPFLTDKDAKKFDVYKANDIDHLLPNVQFLSLHCPAERGAPPLLNANRFNLMQKGSVIINTARGELIDEDALFHALGSNHLLAAGLDSFMQEPVNKNNPLFSLDNVICTPHIGGSTPDALDNMALMAAKNVLAYLDVLSGLEPVDTQEKNRIV